MNKLFLFCLLTALLFSNLGYSQGVEATLLSQWGDDDLIPTSAFNGRYNDVWGVTINDREIAIIGSTAGVHFIDVTDPANAVELKDAFAPGAAQGPNLIHRDFHDYNGYLYVVADEGPSTLQVVDLSGLPDSTEIVYDSNEFFTTAHNVFVDEDNARLYALGADYGAKGVAVYSLANPAQPVELASYPADGNVPYAHDGYIRDNIAYLNCGTSNGFRVYDLTDPKAPVLISEMTGYPQAGYNHSGWLDEVGHYYFMADETWGMDLKVVDVCNEEGTEVVKTFNTGSGVPSSIPHNLIVRCNLLYVSYYHEGLQVFDISDPLNPERIAYYDTYDGPDGTTYQGAWGVYPLFPSGTILISDMQTGLYVFEALPFDCDAYTAKACGDTSTTAIVDLTEDLQIRTFPQPVSDELVVEIDHSEAATPVTFGWYDLSGRLLREEKAQLLPGSNTFRFNFVQSLDAGLYLLKLQGATLNRTEKVVVNNP